MPKNLCSCINNIFSNDFLCVALRPMTEFTSWVVGSTLPSLYMLYIQSVPSSYHEVACLVLAHDNPRSISSTARISFIINN